MRVMCLKCNQEFHWIRYSSHTLYFFVCPGCNKLGLPPMPHVLDEQGILDTLLAITADGGDYYKPKRMKVLLE